MNWHTRLIERRGEDISKRPDGLTDKTDKRGLVGFVGDPDSHSKNIASAPGALSSLRTHLLALAAEMGIPARVVEDLPAVELEATAEQVALCEGHLDGNGDPLPPALLVFYLRTLADRVAS